MAIALSTAVEYIGTGGSAIKPIGVRDASN